jgi:hypothetical protein
MLIGRRAGVLVLAVASNGCLLGDCPGNVHGIKRGETIMTTIIMMQDSPSAPGAWPTCGALGDLDPGTVITWNASLIGPGDGCSDGVDLGITNVTSGAYSNFQIELPNGCRGSWTLQLIANSPDARFTDVPDPSAPSWSLKRTFSATTDPTSCWPGGSAPTTRCEDSFLAHNDPVN